jgi:hypothetical protein
MNRKVVFMLYFVIIVTGLHAEAPELRNVMPNSWRKVTRLTANEEQAFTRENGVVFVNMKEHFYFRSFEKDGNGFGNYTVYKEQAGIDTFYRIIWTNDSHPDFLSPNIRFWQSMVYQGVLLSSVPYNATNATERGLIGYYYSLDIVLGKGKAKGMLMTELVVSKNDFNKDEWGRNAYRKGQLYGYSGCTYYSMNDAILMARAGNYSAIRITASDCLVDPNIPLRYSLQNAFDGDPSTSYVENTDDDLMEFDLVYANYEEIKKIAIINGYAQNMDLYIRNNRVKEITAETYQLNKAQTGLEKIILGGWLCEDNMANYQFLSIAVPAVIRVASVFRGTAYNDTCIAELNFKTQNGWLFGVIDE